MIEITYHRQFHRVTVTGHAFSAEPGQDLVCAGVSALVHTLAQNVVALVSQGSVGKHTVIVQEGQAEIACEPVRRFKAVVSLIYNTVCTGFALMQQQYPEFVSYRVYG